MTYIEEYYEWIKKNPNKVNKKVSKVYEKLVNDILIEEKNCLEMHKNHIDEMVITMKTEMNLINVLEQKSNYVNRSGNI